MSKNVFPFRPDVGIAVHELMVVLSTQPLPPPRGDKGEVLNSP
jgi:hypothetical protein